MTTTYMEKTRKLINCDLGECLDPDPDGQIMPLINQASIACGGHAGNNDSMDRTVKLAKQHRVSIGSHPSYPDKFGFGRVSLAMPLATLFDIILLQVAALEQVCLRHKVAIEYIKPHGALYHDMMQREDVAALLCDVLNTRKYKLTLVVQAGVNTEKITAIAMSKGVQLQFEAFADRKYRGTQLTPRSEAGSLLATSQQIQSQYRQLRESSSFQVDTICFHSDHSPSVIALENIAAAGAC